MNFNQLPLKRERLFVASPSTSRRHALTLAILAIIYPTLLRANPEGAQVISGQVSIAAPEAGVMQITNSPNAIIQWQNFSIANHEITQFIQQNSQSAVLNRIMGENPSAILGQLVSNGKVFLINPNGIVFGADSVTDTQGLLASSLNLSNQDFLKGNYHFMAGSNAGGIVNEGIIRAGKDGHIVLIAPSIKNDGLIQSKGGQITLAAGQQLVITNLDEPDIRFEIQSPSNTVLNLGQLLTEGGAVSLFANTITHSGEINADSVHIDAQGHIQLIAQQDVTLTENSRLSANNSHGKAGTIQVDSKNGTTLVSGTLSANAPTTGAGGTIQLLGEQVGVLNKAQIAVSGQQGGGQILIGGDQAGKNPDTHPAKSVYISANSQLNADAKTQGHGGKVIVWADKSTRAYGKISAKGGAQGGDGGFVETSARQLDTSGIQVNASASHGKAGEWLLDPNDITISSPTIGTIIDRNMQGNPFTGNWTTTDDSGRLTPLSIETALNRGTDVTIKTGSLGQNTQAGDITVASAINKTAGGDAKLSLIADNNIVINANIQATTGKLDLVLTPTGTATLNKPIDLNAGSLTMTQGNANVLSTVLGSALTINKDAKVSLSGAASFNGQFNNSGRLEINKDMVINALNLDGGTLTGSGAVQITSNFNFHSGSLEGTKSLTTNLGSTTQLADTGTAYLGRVWNNLGTINWQGTGALAASPTSLGKLVTIGDFNIGSIETNDTRTLSVAQFNNQGSVTLNGGQLVITSSGVDSGNYQVTAGQLQFQNGSRSFNSGSAVNSDNGQVSFVDNIVQFKPGSAYQVADTQLNNAKLTFNTGASNGIQFPKLSVTHNAWLTGADNIIISQSFDFSAGYLGGNGTLKTLAESTTSLSKNGILLDRAWDNYGSVTYNTIASETSSLPPITLTPKAWNNYGVVSWTGDIGASSVLDSNVLLTNKAEGLININGDASNVSLAISAFHNLGKVDLSGGTLVITGAIASTDLDTGSYKATNTGNFIFAGDRIFSDGQISSETPVLFTSGINELRNTLYTTPETQIAGATVNFTDAVSLENLQLLAGTLSNAKGLTVNGKFTWISGSLAGNGDYNFTNGFGYTTGAMNATGSVTITDHSGTTVFLPAMPSIQQLNVSSAGDVVLNGNIAGTNTLINLTGTNSRLDNVGAATSLSDGHWLLVYANKPSDNTLNGLTPTFKHYGCTATVCKDSFDVVSAATSGNGILYGFTPSLSVIPNTLNSRYGDKPVFTSNVQGFLDTADKASLSGSANYSTNVGGDLNLASVGNYNVAYAGGLKNSLGYKIVDGGAGDEWTILPRDVLITADAVNKVYGELDPKLTYQAKGLVNEDTLSGGLIRADGESVGHYAISAADNLTAGSNYTLKFTGTDLSISPRDVLITADAVNKIYGELDPKLTYQAKGLVNEDTLSGGLIRADGESVGHYAISAADNLTAGSNYTLKFTGADLSITPRDLLITADALDKFQGTPDPILSYRADGLVYDDALTGHLTRQPGEAIGRYPIEQGVLAAGENYNLHFVPADLTINVNTAENAHEELIEEKISTEQNNVLVVTKTESNESSVLENLSPVGESDETGAKKSLKQCK